MRNFSVEILILRNIKIADSFVSTKSVRIIEVWLYCTLDWSLFCKNNLTTNSTPPGQILWYSWPFGTFRSQKLLKLSNQWIAQFYEAISTKFRFIKCIDVWKLTFFSLKWSWNDLKVKYAWIEDKKCLQKFFWGQWGIEWGFKGGLKNVKMLKNCSKLVFLDPHKIPLRDTIDPKFFL